MKSFIESLKAFNATWNDIPRRLLWIIGLFGSLYLLLFALPYIAPFALSALFAWMIEPVIKFVLRRLGDSRALRGIAAAVIVLVLIGLIIVATLYLFNIIVREVKSLASVLPGIASGITQDALAWIDSLNWDSDLWDIGINLEETLTRLIGELSSMVTTLASRVASGAALMALQMVSRLPQGILFIVMTIFGTFYLSADKERIFAFYRRLLPEKFQQRSTMVRSSFFLAIFGQVRAAFFIFLGIFVALTIGFLIMQMEYAILFALIIAFVDMLPVLGAGMFLFPMIAYGVISGNLLLGLGSIVMYVIVVMIRNFLQPSIVGKQIGMHPLLTMIAMYAGFMAMGVLGMLLAPMMLMLCKIVLVEGQEEAAVPAEASTILSKMKPRRKGKRRGR